MTHPPAPPPPTATQVRDWLDNRLAPAELAAFEDALETNPAFAGEVLRLQEELPRYDDGSAALRAAYPLDDTVPTELVARLGLAAAVQESSAAAPETPAAVPDNVVDFAAARARHMAQQPAPRPAAPRGAWRWAAGGALAASLALAVMLAPQLRHRAPGADQRFQLALSQTPSAAEAPLGGNATLRPSLSFAAADGRWCREFVITPGPGAAGGAQSGIACTAGRGWSVEATAKTGEQPAASGEIRTAGGADTAPLDAAYGRLGGSDPIAMDQERQLIAQGWPRPAR